MLEELVKAVQDGVKTEVITANGREFTTKSIVEIPDLPLAKSLECFTLQSIVDYLNNNIDQAKDSEKDREIFIHIVNFKTVNLCAFLNTDRRREILLTAKYEPTSFLFGQQYDQEKFITLLQTSFVETDARKTLQKIIGGLVEDSSLKLTDDGISQNTVAQSGVTMVERARVENPVRLQPFRTFSEVEQPESPFILRLHKQSEGVPTISLHEADNSQWKVKAIENIRDFFTKKVKVPVIA